MRNDDLRWYNSLMASNRDSNQSSFSLRVLQKIKKCYQLFKKKIDKNVLCVQFHGFMIISDVKCIGCDQIISLEDLHIVHMKFGT